MKGYSVQITVQVEANSKAEAIDVVGRCHLVPLSLRDLDFEVAGAEQWPEYLNPGGAIPVDELPQKFPEPAPVWLAALQAFDSAEYDSAE